MGLFRVKYLRGLEDSEGGGEVLTSANTQPDSAQEVIAGQGLPVPHSQFQAHVLEIFQPHTIVDKCMVVVGIQGLLHHRSFTLTGLVPHGKEVSGRGCGGINNLLKAGNIYLNFPFPSHRPSPGS